jgi:hypothetical protein
MMKKLLTVAAVALVLAACSSNPGREKIVIKNVPTEVTKPRLALPDIPRPRLRTTKFIVITPENYAAVFKELEVTGQPVILFALSEKGYRAVKTNDAEFLAYIKKQRSVIMAYKAYYEPVTKKKK